jgi:hypothetical protein
MKKKTAIFTGIGFSTLTLALWSAGAGAQQLGDNFTVIVPAGAVANLRQVLVVTGAPKAAATKVGNCAPGDVHLQDAQLVDREPPPRSGRGGEGGADAPVQKLPTVTTQVAIAFPGASGVSRLKPGWHLGSWRSGGKCGPGYDVYVAHIIAIE